MKRIWKTLLDFLLLTVVAVPIMIDAPSKDTTRTKFGIWGSGGQYAVIARGCNGDILHEQGIGYSEMGGQLSRGNHKLETGILAHVVFDKKEVEKEILDPHYGYSTGYDYPKRTLFAINPFAEFKARYVGIGAGLFWSSEPLPKIENPKIIPTFHIRFGNLKSIYFEGSFFQHPQLYSGNYFRLGLGSNKPTSFHPWFGVGFGPHDELGLIGRETFLLKNKLNLQLLIRLGISSVTPEPAIGLGLSYKK